MLFINIEYIFKTAIMHPFKWYKYRTMILFTDTLKIKEEIRNSKKEMV